MLNLVLNHNAVRRYIIVLFISIIFSGTCHTLDCTTVPVSVSSLNQCIDNQCSTTVVADVAINAQNGQITCLQLVSPDSGVPVVNLTIVNRDFFFVFTNDYRYYSSDYNYTAESICACPNTPAVDCLSCPTVLPVGPSTLCTSGSSNSQGCNGGGISTWCLNLNFDTLTTHYSITKYKSVPSIIGRFDFYVDGNLFPFDYAGSILQSADVSDVLVATVTSNTANSYPVEYGVYDMIHKGQMYLLGGDLINPLNGFDPTKIGGVKVGQPTETNPALMSAISVKVLGDKSSCANNNLLIKNYFAQPHVLLSQNQDKRAGVLLPGAFVLHNPFVDNTPITTLPDRFIKPYTRGFHLLDVDGPVSIGYDDRNTVSFFPDAVLPNQIINTRLLFMDPLGTQSCKTGMWRVAMIEFRGYDIDTLDPVDYLIVLGKGVTPADNLNIEAWLILKDTNIQGWLSHVNDTIYCPAVVGSKTRSFAALQFPDTRLHAFFFNAGETLVTSGVINTALISFDVVANTTDFPLDDTLWTPAVSGELQLTLTFKNVTVNFVSSTVKPVITNATTNATGYANVCYKSTTNAGDCYISSKPTLFASTSIDVDKTITCTDFPPYIETMDAPVTIFIVCRTNSANKTIIVEFNINPTDTGTTDTTVNGTTTDTQASDSDWWSFLSNPFDFSLDGLNPIAWLGKAPILLIEYAVLAVIAIGIIFVAFKVLMSGFGMITSRIGSVKPRVPFIRAPPQ